MFDQTTGLRCISDFDYKRNQKGPMIEVNIHDDGEVGANILRQNQENSDPYMLTKVQLDKGAYDSEKVLKSVDLNNSIAED